MSYLPEARILLTDTSFRDSLEERTGVPVISVLYDQLSVFNRLLFFPFAMPSLAKNEWLVLHLFQSSILMKTIG